MKRSQGHEVHGDHFIFGSMQSLKYSKIEGQERTTFLRTKGVLTSLERDLGLRLAHGQRKNPLLMLRMWWQQPQMARQMSALRVLEHLG